MSGRGLIELLVECDSVELWAGQEPNAQLLLLWLLNHCGSEGAAVSKLVMRQLDVALADVELDELAKRTPPTIDPRQGQVELAERAWRAYRARTPQAWCDLLKANLGPLPRLEQCVVSLLEELPSAATGLAATEARILELIAPGDVHPFDVFPGHEKRNERRVFDYWEVGALLDGLARCDRPAVVGLDEGPFSLEMHNDSVRFDRYKQSQLSLTEFGKAVLGGDQNFRRYNRIDR